MNASGDGTIDYFFNSANCLQTDVFVCVLVEGKSLLLGMRYFLT